MGRPRRNTASWFPHRASASGEKILAVLENNFGSDGYKAFFKLQEILTSTDNHFLEVGDSESIEFLAARISLPPDRLLGILNKMASQGLKAIDRALWGHRIIWCQDLVDDLKPVYDKRNQELPRKPDISGTENGVSVPGTGFSVPETSRCPYQEILDLWVSLLVPPLPAPEIPIDTGSTRAKIMRVRWRKDPDIEVFRSQFQKVKDSDFLTGRSGRWSGCSIDWVLKASNWQKLKEGNYDNKGGSDGQSQQSHSGSVRRVVSVANTPSGAFADVAQ